MLFRYWKRLSKQDGRFCPGLSVKVKLYLVAQITEVAGSVNVGGVFRSCDVRLPCWRVFPHEACWFVFCLTGEHRLLQSGLIQHFSIYFREKTTQNSMALLSSSKTSFWRCRENKVTYSCYCLNCIKMPKALWNLSAFLPLKIKQWDIQIAALSLSVLSFPMGMMGCLV